MKEPLQLDAMMVKSLFFSLFFLLMLYNCRSAQKEPEKPWDNDKQLYKQRNQVERLFRRLKRFRRIFTRYDKLDTIFLAFIYFALIVDALM